MFMKRLITFVFLLLIGIGLGGVIWWWRGNYSPKTTSIRIDGSLSDEKIETEKYPSVDYEIPETLKNAFLDAQPGIRDIDIEKLQDPFVQSSCSIKMINTCLVNIFLDKETGKYVVRQGELRINVPLVQSDLQFAFGRILGQPDNVRAFFVKKYGSIDSYLLFVQHVSKVSQKYRINPVFVYSLYDYYLGTSLKVSQPVEKLPTPKLLVDRIDYSLQQFNNGEDFPEIDKVSPQFLTLDWTTEGKALGMSFAWTMADEDLFTALFSQSGGVDFSYSDRIQSDFDNKPFTVSFTEEKVSQQSYEENQAVSRGLAICQNQQAALCDLTESSETLWNLKCSRAPFLDQFCNGILPNLSL